MLMNGVTNTNTVHIYHFLDRENMVPLFLNIKEMSVDYRKHHKLHQRDINREGQTVNIIPALQSKRIAVDHHLLQIKDDCHHTTWSTSTFALSQPGKEAALPWSAMWWDDSPQRLVNLEKLIIGCELRNVQAIYAARCLHKTRSNLEHLNHLNHYRERPLKKPTDCKTTFTVPSGHEDVKAKLCYCLMVMLYGHSSNMTIFMSF